MAPKAEKKLAQPAKKAVAKKSSAGRKKGSKKAVESYKIYIYKVRHQRCSLQAYPDCIDCKCFKFRPTPDVKLWPLTQLFSV